MRAVEAEELVQKLRCELDESRQARIVLDHFIVGRFNFCRSLMCFVSVRFVCFVCRRTKHIKLAEGPGITISDF